MLKMGNTIRTVWLALCGLLLCTPAGAASMERVSVSSLEEEVEESSINPAISDDGRFVAFYSRSRELVPGDDDARGDMFVRDRRNGTTERIPAGGLSFSPSISGDGNIVVFDGLGIQVRDRASGVTRSLPFNSSDDPVISSNGRYVASSSSDKNLVPNDTNIWNDVFVYDLQSNTIERVSVSSAEVEADRWSGQPSISADGRFVAFESGASNLAPGDTPDVPDIFIRDRQTGTTEQVSVGFDPPGNYPVSNPPALTSDGRFVAFEVVNFIETTTDFYWDVRLYLRDRQAGTTERIDVNDAGETANDSSYGPTISADGNIIAFVSDATNLAPTEANPRQDIFIRNRVNNTTRKMKIRHPQQIRQGVLPVITPDGRFIAFESGSWELAPGDDNNEIDVFVYDSSDALDDRDDLLINFGSQGLWERLNDSTWIQIGGFPKVIASGDLDGNTNDEAIAGFSGRGLLARYNNRAPWVKLHDAVPLRVVTGDLTAS